MRDQTIQLRILGARLWRARLAASLTQDEVATEFGCHQTAISRLEQGEREVRAHELFDFAKLYRTTPDALIGPYTQAEKELEVELGRDMTYDHSLLPRRRWRRGGRVLT